MGSWGHRVVPEDFLRFSPVVSLNGAALGQFQEVMKIFGNLIRKQEAILFRCLGESMVLNCFKIQSILAGLHGCRCSMFQQHVIRNRDSNNHVANSGINTHRIRGTGIFTHIWLIFMVNVGKCTIHGSYGI